LSTEPSGLEPDTPGGFFQDADKVEKDPKKVQLGDRIRELREVARLSREQLADGAGVSIRAVIQWEVGEREPGWFNMLALAEALGVEVTAFLTEPAERPQTGPGRPPRRAAELAEQPVPKRPRGRPRKGK
jgi:transcriptional regulator with XRE-family HTH domain